MFLFAILLFLQYRLWFEKDGIDDLQKIKLTLDAQLKENQQIKALNDKLTFQINRMKDSKDNIEAKARNELGMIKRDEKFYQIVK